MEIRKDYILDRYVFLAEDRKKRPKEFKKKETQEKRKTCSFCPGNEHLTPKETGRIEKNGKWMIRWFPNLYPVVSQKSTKKQTKKFFISSPSLGKHEVIAETNNHKEMFWDLPTKHIEQILKVCKERINELGKEKKIKYVDIFKNHGREAGTSLLHSHTQVVSLPKVPELVKEEITASEKYHSCPHCKIIKIEKKGPRMCFENSDFVAFTPYASRFNFEIWIFPKKHIKDLNNLDDKGFANLAKILKKVLVKLRKLNTSYNFFLHYSPKGKDLHFHLEITPRLAAWAGFELSSNEKINSVSPEHAAKFYRSK